MTQNQVQNTIPSLAITSTLAGRCTSRLQQMRNRAMCIYLQQHKHSLLIEWGNPS